MQPLGLRIGEGSSRLWGTVRARFEERLTRRRRMTPSRTVVTPAAPPTLSSRPAPSLRAVDGAAASPGHYAELAVANIELRRPMVPAHGAPWEQVEEFALSYDGYAHWNELAELGARGQQGWARDRTLPGSLDELRGCLFFEQRRWHHFGEEPDGRAAAYVHALLDAIRAVVPGPPQQMPTAHTAPAGLAPPAAPVAPSVVCFAGDETAYVEWSTAHPGGFVLNAPSKAATVARLHRARCSSVSPVAAGQRRGAAQRKACAEDRDELTSWAGNELGRPLEACRRCRP